MSRHEGVSCDSCLKGNFRGKRYKCLICYDYDLCSTCYEAGATSTRHTTEHPMQCILTRADFELYYGGEAISSDQPQSFTCPYCGRMGFTENTLTEHVTSEHSDVNFEVVCPICASMPVGDPNLVTDDFAGHLTLEHRNTTRDLISFLDEPSSRHGVRRVPPPSSRAISSRARRSNMHFRENVDPIAELLSQLSGVRRNQGSTPSQLQHLQMQLQLERQQAARQQLERMPRRAVSAQQVSSTSLNTTCAAISFISASSQDNNSSGAPRFLLQSYLEQNHSEQELEKIEESRADRCLFARELLLGALSEVPDISSDQNLVIANLLRESFQTATATISEEQEDATIRIEPSAPECTSSIRSKNSNSHLGSNLGSSLPPPSSSMSSHRKSSRNSPHPGPPAH